MTFKQNVLLTILSSDVFSLYFTHAEGKSLLQKNFLRVSSEVILFPNTLVLDFFKEWYVYLLPTGSEEREVLGVGSIHVAILPSCQYMINIVL